MRRLLRGSLILVAILIACAGTLYALAEWDEVVILRSDAGTGEMRATHLWVVDDAGGWQPVAVRLDPR